MCSPSIRTDQDGVQGLTRIPTNISFSDNVEAGDRRLVYELCGQEYSVQKAGRMERSQSLMENAQRVIVPPSLMI